MTLVGKAGIDRRVRDLYAGLKHFFYPFDADF
jgi:hypothetical protein